LGFFLSCHIQFAWSRGTHAANYSSIIVSQMTRDRTRAQWHCGTREVSRSIKDRFKVQLSHRKWHVTGRAQWYCGTREVSRSTEPDASYRIAICARQDAHSREGAMWRNRVFCGTYL